MDDTGTNNVFNSDPFRVKSLENRALSVTDDTDLTDLSSLDLDVDFDLEFDDESVSDGSEDKDFCVLEEVKEKEGLLHHSTTNNNGRKRPRTENTRIPYPNKKNNFRDNIDASVSTDLIPINSWVDEDKHSGLQDWNTRKAMRQNIQELNEGTEQDGKLHIIIITYKQTEGRQPTTNEVFFTKPRFIAWRKDCNAMMVEGTAIVQTITQQPENKVVESNSPIKIEDTVTCILASWKVQKNAIQNVKQIAVLVVEWSFIISICIPVCERVYVPLKPILTECRNLSLKHYKMKASVISNCKDQLEIIDDDNRFKQMPLWIQLNVEDKHNVILQTKSSRTVFRVYDNIALHESNPEKYFIVDEKTEPESIYFVSPEKMVDVAIRLFVVSTIGGVENGAYPWKMPSFTLSYGQFNEETTNINLDPMKVLSVLDTEKLSFHERDMNSGNRDEALEVLLNEGKLISIRFEIDFNKMRLSWRQENQLKLNILNCFSNVTLPMKINSS